MSLKAKIEAVIYASEEPVTLAQLVGLLGEEAQAELDRAVTQQTLALVETEAEVAAEPVLGEDLSSDGAEAVELEPVEAAPDVAEAGTDGAEATPEPAAESPDLIAAAVKAEKARLARLRAHFREVLDQLVAEYATPERGLEIREVGGGFRLATKPEYHDAVRGFVKSLKPPLKLTLQALETLAVVAYKQPVTAPEISEIRGVDSGGVLGSLLTRKLIATAGRKQVIGRPILYKTTKDFLVKFGLKDVGELPSIEEFEKMAGQLAEQEEMAMEHETPEGAERPESAETVESPESPESPEAPESTESIEDRLESDQEAAAPEPVADETIVDGREAGLPPRYDDADAADDPSAVEAEIQSSGEDL
jgi:segregation and condensation protein B